MTLDELLALLPDNTSGEIDADDLRTIVTELFNRSVASANTVAQVFGYQWQVSPVNPSNGRASIDPAWGIGSTKVVVNNTTDSGLTLTFAVLDALVDAEVTLVGTNGGVLHGVITGPTVDMGSYREIPIAVAAPPTGSPPINNEKVSLVVRGIVP